MKANLFLFVIIILLTQISCETDFKQEKITEYDQINYHEINKLLSGISKDSIYISCYPIIIEIKLNPDTSSSDSLLAFIKYPAQIPLGDCGIQYFSDTLSNRLKCLAVNNTISQYSQWSTSTEHTLSLDDFKGKGEKYIGFRILTLSYPNHIDYSYGWIRVELSANNDSLRIINFANNTTINKSILTAQRK